MTSSLTHARTNTPPSIILLAVGFATPIFVSSLGYLPFMSRLQDTLNPRLAWPSLIGTYHVRALPFSIGIAPTLGQTWYIALMTVLAIILTGVGHKSTQPNAWFTSSWRETMNYISNRTAVHAFCLAPLVVLFAGRNNILLYLTNWPHATFILLHRWVARLFGLQVLVHALLELAIYRQNHSLAAEQSHPYWLWGVGGVVVYLVLVATSVLPARRKSYELFLVTHIVLAALMLVAAWYHVRLMHGGANWGYQYWLYATFAVWAADRALRVLRVLKNGVHRARVRLVADGIVRVDVPGVRWDAQPGKHAYVFFPGLNRARPWENHPFSVVPTALLGGGVADVGGDVDGVDTDLSDTDTETSPASSPTQHTRPELVVDDVDIEKQTHILDVSKSALDTKNPATTTTMTTTTALPPRTPSRAPPATGITLFIRPGTGLTARLLASPSPSSPSPPTSLPLLTLLDGPYSTPSLTPTLAPSPPILRAHRLILIAGGVGITGELPLLHAHPNAALHWGVKEAARGLVGEVSGALGLARARAQARAGAARSRRAGEGGGEDVQGEVEVYVGARMAVRGLLEREAEAAWGRVGVVVCGPGPLCDEVRSEVGRCAREARGGTAWELEVEAFSW